MRWTGQPERGIYVHEVVKVLCAIVMSLKRSGCRRRCGYVDDSVNTPIECGLKRKGIGTKSAEQCVQYTASVLYSNSGIIMMKMVLFCFSISIEWFRKLPSAEGEHRVRRSTRKHSMNYGLNISLGVCCLFRSSFHLSGILSLWRRDWAQMIAFGDKIMNVISIRANAVSIHPSHQPQWGFADAALTIVGQLFRKPCSCLLPFPPEHWHKEWT